PASTSAKIRPKTKDQGPTALVPRLWSLVVGLWSSRKAISSAAAITGRDRQRESGGETNGAGGSSVAGSATTNLDCRLQILDCLRRLSIPNLKLKIKNMRRAIATTAPSGASQSASACSVAGSGATISARLRSGFSTSCGPKP